MKADKKQREPVIKAIRAVFPAEPLDADSAFGERGTTYLDGDRFVSDSRGKRWTSLDAEFLRWHHDAVYFLSPDAFCQYLPAFLTAVIRDYENVDILPRFVASALTRSDDSWSQKRFDEIVRHLSEEQQRVVAQALEELERLTEPNDLDNPARMALDSYWSDLVRK